MKQILVIYLFLLSCNVHHPQTDVNLSIIIRHGESYEIDLEKKMFTIFYLAKAPLTIKIKLDDRELKMIREKYYSLNLYKISKNLDINDKCTTMPKVYTFIHVRSTSFHQQIKIDESCDKFYFPDAGKAQRIKRFVQYIQEVIESKPEIKNAPKSDIRYI